MAQPRTSINTIARYVTEYGHLERLNGNLWYDRCTIHIYIYLNKIASNCVSVGLAQAHPNKGNIIYIYTAKYLFYS